MRRDDGRFYATRPTLDRSVLEAGSQFSTQAVRSESIRPVLVF